MVLLYVKSCWCIWMSQRQNNNEWFQREETTADDPSAVHQSAARTADCSFKMENKSLILSSQRYDSDVFCPADLKTLCLLYQLLVCRSAVGSMKWFSTFNANSNSFHTLMSCNISVTLLCVWLLKRSAIVKLNETVTMVTAAPLIGGVPCCLHGACG